MGKVFMVRAIWDDEANVWSVDESDIPGLCAWATSIPELRRKVAELAPELIELNAHLLHNGDPRKVPISLIAHTEQSIRAGC